MRMDTAFGPVHFDDKGQNEHPVIVTQVQNGKFVTVYPKDAASGQMNVPTPDWSARK
jgi:branched-chain amino acid transport system substrate-binding protein